MKKVVFYILFFSFICSGIVNAKPQSNGSEQSTCSDGLFVIIAGNKPCAENNSFIRRGKPTFDEGEASGITSKLTHESSPSGIKSN